MVRDIEGQSLLTAESQPNQTKRILAVSGLAVVACLGVVAVKSQQSQASLMSASTITSATVAPGVRTQRINGVAGVPVARPVVSRALPKEAQSGQHVETMIQGQAAPQVLSHQTMYETSEEIPTSTEPQFQWANAFFAMLGMTGAAAAGFALFRSFASQQTSQPESTGHQAQWAMMASNASDTIASNYGRALLDASKDAKATREVKKDVDVMVKYMTDPDISNIITSPIFNAAQKIDLVKKIAAEAEMKQTTINFMCYVIDADRADMLNEIFEVFADLYNQEMNITMATVESAVPLTEEQVLQISKKIQGMTGSKEIAIKSKIKPELMAGLIINFGSETIDLSVATQLKKIAASMKNIDVSGVGAVQAVAFAIACEALVPGSAHAAAGKLFDFNATLPIMAAQFLILMVFLDKTWFTPVGEHLDKRDAELRSMVQSIGDNSAEVKRLGEEAAEILSKARMESKSKVEALKKELQSKNDAEMAKAKAQVDKELEAAVAELNRLEQSIFQDLEKTVVPTLVDDIVDRVLPKEVMASA